jgi:chromosome segregation ATPase
MVAKEVNVKRQFRSIVLGASVWAVVGLSAQGQQSSVSTKTEDSTLSALLNEVRLLRLALERSAVLLPRMQMNIQRLQYQQERVDRLARELDEFRRKEAASVAEDVRLAAAVKTAESELAQESDARRKRDMEAKISETKAQLEQGQLTHQQQRAREVELSSQLDSERIKLTELSESLRAIEQMLSSDRPAGSIPK